MSSEPYISNDLFILYSDVVFIDREDPKIIAQKLLEGIRKRENPIIFVNTIHIFYYMPFLNKIYFPFVLITTCNDDICVPYIHYPPTTKDNMLSILENPFLKLWFSKNPCITHKKLAPIPLGPKWQYNSWNFFGEDKKPIIHVLNKHCLTPLDNFMSYTESNDALDKIKTKLLYFNFGKTTESPFILHHKNIRDYVERICVKNGFTQDKNEKFEQYMATLKEYKFCLSPPGRGVDTHRTWEALMVGTIPIMISTALDSLFEHLPVLIIDDWEKITPDFLEEAFIKIHSRTYDFSILYADFWKKKICSL